MPEKQKTNKHLPLVVVVWEDITQSGVDWQTVEEALDWADNEVNIVHQAGFELDRTEDHIIITESMFKDGDTVGSVTKIPMAVVKKLIPIQYEE